METIHTPKDTENTIYIMSDSYDLEDLIEKCKEKWGDDVDFSKLNISCDEIQVRNFGFDRYDPSDYCFYIIIEYDP